MEQEAAYKRIEQSEEKRISSSSGPARRLVSSGIIRKRIPDNTSNLLTIGTGAGLDKQNGWPSIWIQLMINLRPKVIVTLLVVSTMSATLRVVDGRSLRSNKERDKIIDVCKLKEDPSRFAGKTFRLKAVLVENRTPRVDGGESYLYGPGCRKSSLSVVVDFASEESYQSIGVLKPDDGYVRANVVFLGVFNYSDKRKFGHLDWADSQFVVQKVIEAHRTG